MVIFNWTGKKVYIYYHHFFNKHSVFFIVNAFIQVANGEILPGDDAVANFTGKLIYANLNEDEVQAMVTYFQLMKPCGDQCMFR